MSRGLLNAASLVAITVFVVALGTEFLFSDAPTSNPVLGAQPTQAEAVDQAAEIISEQRENASPNHQIWQRISGFLRQTQDPFGALVALDTRLGDDAQQTLAATGFAAYYTGYNLMLDGDEEQARRCWEFGLGSFEHWAHTPRPQMGGFDRIYHARTLMRLGRDAEAVALLHGLSTIPSGPYTYESLEAIARTLAQSGARDEAAAAFDDAFAVLDPASAPRVIRRLASSTERWKQSREPLAAAAALDAAVRLARIETRGEISGSLLIALRHLGLALQANQRERDARAVWALGDRACLKRLTEEDPPNPAAAWMWAAKFRALAGDTDGAAEALRAGAGLGPMSPDTLTADPDLAPLMRLPALRSAVRLYGEPDSWSRPSPIRG